MARDERQKRRVDPRNPKGDPRKTKKRRPNPKAPLTPEQRDSIAVQDLVGPDARGADVIAKNLYGEGSLGRVNEERPEAVQDYINRYYSGLEGYAAPELQGMREQAQRGVDTQYQTGLAQLAKAQARSGVRGASAAAQQTNLDRMRLGQQQQLEQDLFVRNADERQNRLGEYAGALEGARGDELARRQFNLGQLGTERAGQSGTYFGALNLGQQRRGQEQSYNISKQMLNLAKRQARGSRGGGAPGPDYQGYTTAVQGAYNNVYG